MKNTTHPFRIKKNGLILAFCLCATNVIYSQKINSELFHVWAQCQDGTTYRWGYNANGQLSTGNTVNASSPVQLATPTSVIDVVPNHKHSLLLKSDGTVWASGNNTYGQLGIGSTTNQLSFVQVNTITNAVKIAVGMDCSYALTSLGQVYSWGENGQGSVGDGTTIHRNSPVLLAGLSGITAIDGSDDAGYALKNDGTVWAWGSNDLGQVGNGVTGGNVLSPVQVSGLTNVIAISANERRCLALKSDGTVWAWGVNWNGQLGDGTTTHRNVPVQVSGLTNVTAISAGYLHSIVVKNDGTIWAWGVNGFGELGDGTTTDKLIPVQSTSLSGVVTSVSAGHYSSYAVKNDGTMWSWGWNVFGQLGDGTTTNRMTPVQIPIICAIPLPIELLSFDATCVDRSIQLTWSTASETNNNYFTIERSTDGVSFTPIQTIEGAGNSTQQLNYYYKDEPVQLNQLYYYRLKQTDFDGEVKIYPHLRAEKCKGKEEMIVFTNPTDGIIIFQFSQANFHADYKIFDQIGKLIISGQLSSKDNIVDISNCSNGCYYLHIQTDFEEINKKIIIQH